MAQSNITSGFIDIATYDEIEKYKFWLTKRSDEPRDQRPENSTGIIE